MSEWLPVAAGTGSALVGGFYLAAAIETRPLSPLRVASAAGYLVGWASTMAINVPLNNSLSRKGSGHLEGQWHGYERPWTRANHLLAVLSVAGAAGLLAPVSTS